jgi:SAM-dependent methyltransferase
MSKEEPMIDKHDICPISNATDAYVFLSLLNVPVHCNVLWPTREAALRAPRGDIVLAFSPHSGHVWNTAFDPTLMQYTQQYENSLHFSPRFQQFAETLAQRLIGQFNIRNKDVVEIGCGKGEFLALLCELGNNRGYGYDPSYVPAHRLEQAGGRITFVQDMYGEKYADQQADLICCRHVLEHVPSPIDMLLSVRRAIGNQRTSVTYFEVPNVLFTLRDLAVWDIIYEHCSYFSAGSLAYAFAESGFDTLSVREEFGSQFLSITALPARDDTEAQRVTWGGLEQMREYVDMFAEHYRGKIATWRERLSVLAQADKKVVIWGAGSKGVTFLNTLRTHEQVAYAVDINPRKQGMYIAGTGQEIVSPEFLCSYRPDAVILMNSIYREEVQRMLINSGVQAELLLV